MNGDPFKTPLNKARLDGQSRTTTAAKRDSLAAELERGMKYPLTEKWNLLISSSLL